MSYQLRIRCNVGTAVAPLPGNTLAAAKSIAAAWRVMLGNTSPKFFKLEIINDKGETEWTL